MLNQVVPRLRAAIPQVVSLVGCEDAEEINQDAIATAARMLHSAEAAGKKVTAGNVAYYAIQHMKAGRRSTRSSKVDVMAAGTQVSGRTRVISLEELVPTEGADNETFTLGDVLSSDREDPAMIATRRLDWQSFCHTQPTRSRAILKSAALGEPLTKVAKRHRVSRSAIQANKQTLAQEIRQYMGADILLEAIRLPLWKHNLAANRERFAWRHGAKH